MTDQTAKTAAGRAAQAEHRAQEQQRRTFRNVLQDPAARALLTSDPEFRRLVAEEVAAERSRQEQEDAHRHSEAARQKSAAMAPRQTSTNASPWDNDPAHAPQVLAALLNGSPAQEVQRLVAIERDRQARAAADRITADGFMWETRNGPLMADSAKQFPATGPGLPPRSGRQRSRPLPQGPSGG